MIFQGKRSMNVDKQFREASADSGQKIAALEAQLAQLEQSSSTEVDSQWSAKYKTLEKEYQSVEPTYQAVVRQLKGKVRGLERKVAASERLAQALPSSSEIGKQLKGAGDLKAQVAALQKDNNTLEASVARLNAEIASANTSALAAQHEKEGALKKFAEVRKQLHDGEAQTTDLVGLRKAAEVRHELARALCASFKEQARDGAESIVQLFTSLGMPARSCCIDHTARTLQPEISPGDGSANQTETTETGWRGLQLDESTDGYNLTQIKVLPHGSAAAAAGGELAEGDVVLVRNPAQPRARACRTAPKTAV